MRRRVEDLHGFDVATAVSFAARRVREAYAGGLDEIEFVHGAANVSEPPGAGRGGIKWALRDLLDSGRLDQWARREACWPKASSLVIALRRNPQPRREYWSPPPRRAVPR